MAKVAILETFAYLKFTLRRDGNSEVNNSCEVILTYFLCQSNIFKSTL